MRASLKTSSSEMSRMTTGTSVRPAARAAWYLRSPATISYPVPFLRTRMGCRMPFCLMESVSSARSSGLKRFLGCPLFGFTRSMGRVESGRIPAVSASASPTRSPRPLPSPVFLATSNHLFRQLHVCQRSLAHACVLHDGKTVAWRLGQLHVPRDDRVEHLLPEVTLDLLDHLV